VQKFALAAQPPFTAVEDDDRDFVLTVDGAHGAPRVEKPVAEATVGAGYFAALNEPVLAGREFTEADVRSADERNRSEGTAAAMPLLLNETAARDLFGSGDAVGRRVRKELQAYDVTGVVRDVSNGSGINQPIAYLPLASRDFARPPAGGITILVRAAAGADAMGAVRRAIGSIDPNLTLFGAETLSESLERSRYVLWSALRTYGGIGVFGLILSALGLAGVTAYAVARRGKEIGIRMALGASRGQVLRLVLREGAALIAVGLALGFAGALALVKALSAMANLLVEAFRMGTGDLRLLVGAPLLLAALALVACYVPARRAVKIDPLKALRQE
jgi:ABC-type antimicrobial peptide transport system permease subunit